MIEASSGTAVAASSPGVLVTTRYGLILAVIFFVFVVFAGREASVVGNARLTSSGDVHTTRPEYTATSRIAASMPVVKDDDAEGPVDLYGNEVTAAVAQYKLDSTGSLYELHSPQTELPRLAVPKS